MKKALLFASSSSLLLLSLLVRTEAFGPASYYFPHRPTAGSSSTGTGRQQLVVGRDFTVAGRRVFSRRSPRTAAATAATRTSASSSSYDLASNLLELLLEEKKGGPANSNNSEKNENKKTTVEYLVGELTQPPSAANAYDPDSCLYGDLYCTMCAFTPGDPVAPAPLWERISLRPDNVKGQQYFKGADGEDEGEEGCGSVINYSEILGPNLHLRASGTFEPRRRDERQEGANEEQTEDNRKQPGDLLGSLFGEIVRSATSTGSSKQRQQLRTCPDDYAVTVRGASIHLLGKSIDVPIRGTSFLRVLYADPRLRVFVSLVGSDSIAGEWESTGLTVVQIRSDLVVGLTGGKPVDLRN